MKLNVLEILTGILRQPFSAQSRRASVKRRGACPSLGTGEPLEGRQVLSAISVGSPIAVDLGVPVSVEGSGNSEAQADFNSQVESRARDLNARKAGKAFQQTIDSPVGPIDLKLRNEGTKVRGVANVHLLPGAGIPNVTLSPVRFKAEIKNFQLLGEFKGRAGLPLGGSKQKFTGTVTAVPQLLNPGTLAGHYTIQIGGATVADSDFDLPLSTLLQLIQNQTP